MKQNYIIACSMICLGFCSPVLALAQWPLSGTEQQQPSAPKHHIRTEPVKAGPQSAAGLRLALFSRGTDPRAVEQSRKWKEALDRGDAQRKAGDLDGALESYQDALSIEPGDGFTLQEMAEVYTAKGQPDEAIAAYRKFLFSAAGSLQGSNVTALMHFAQVLIKTGQPDEALTIYRYALGFVNYCDGQPHHPALLPDFTPPGWDYTPERLQAMVDVALALEIGTSDEEQAASLREAARLFPRSAIPPLYMGLYLRRYSDKEARPSFQKAADLSDGAASAAAKKFLP